MNIKRNIIFALEGRKKNGVAITENVPIRMRVNYSGQRIEFTMPYRIDAAKWDAAKQRVKNGCTNKLKVSASEINAELTRSYTLIQDIFKEFELQELMPTTEQLKDVYTSRSKVEDPKTEELVHQKTFWEIYDEFTEENGKLNDWTKATFEKFAAQRNHLHDFNPNISFNDFTEDGLNDYIEFLGHQLEMRNSTISKQVGFLKWFLRWSMKKGYHQNAAFETYKPKLKNPDKAIIFLTRKEQEQLRDYQIPGSKQYLERVRDVFSFCCFTGLRYSDAYNLRRSDIKDDHIDITTIKTTDHLKIELNKHSRSILDKYKDVPFKDDKALPVISNQRMNEYLKELCELAGIDSPVHITYYRGQQRIDETRPKYELMGTHAGRRTFICNAILLGIPANVIMKWTGHSDYKAMKPYIDVADETKVSAMSKFDLMKMPTMIIEPERYFQYTVPKLHTLWNGKNRDFSRQAITGFQHFISAYQDKKLVVLISEQTKDKLQAYYDANAKQDGNVPLLELSHAGRWYANGFMSAFNFCEQYEKEHPSAKVDFSFYADKLEQTNETQSSAHSGLNHNYIINIGRIEGVRFYLKEHESADIIDDKTLVPPQPQDETSLVEETTMFNSTGLTLEQNLKPASSNKRVIRAIEEILKRHKGKKSERTIVGYCIIAIRGLVKDDASEKILTAAFRNDYFPADDIDKFSASIYRVLRAYSKKDSKWVHNPDEQWGEQKESILQEVKTQIRKAISSI